jgi:hypothetical protein
MRVLRFSTPHPASIFSISFRRIGDLAPRDGTPLRAPEGLTATLDAKPCDDTLGRIERFTF